MEERKAEKRKKEKKEKGKRGAKKMRVVIGKICKKAVCESFIKKKNEIGTRIYSTSQY